MAKPLCRWKIFVRQFISSSLRWKLWLLLFGTICAILLTFTVLISHTTSSHMQQTFFSTSENLLYQGAQNLENYLHTIEATSLIPYSNSALYQRISTDSSPIYEVDSYVSLALKAIASSDPTIHQVHLYVDSQKASYLVRSTFYSKSVCETAPAQQPLLLETLHQSGRYGVGSIQAQRPQSVVSLHRTLYRVPEDTYIGQIDIDLTPSYLDSVMQKLKTDQRETVFLIDSNGTVLYTPDAQPALPDHIAKMLPEATETGFLSYPESVSTKEYLFYSNIELSCGSFLLLKVTPIAVLNSANTQLLNLIWLTSLLILLVSSAALFAISARFTAPIAQLAQHMDRIRQGNMTVPISTNRIDEIGRLINEFQSMMDSINELIRQRYQLELANKNSQLLALQAQLNPHFINNTIQSIGTCALNAGNREIYTQLAGFGSMMQYCMDFKTSLVPLSQETQFVEQYLYFQKLRFSNRFVYSVQAPAELLQTPVPKMLLQPLVENAFVHGRLQDRTNGFLLLTIREEEKSLFITVEDNGAGADEAALQRLRDELVSASSSTPYTADHIGIYTSYARLRLYYGNQAAIQVQNRPRGGFILTLSLPKKEVQSHESPDC